MGPLDALLLGILQGLTEFLPISSTAHLTLAGIVLGIVGDADPEKWTATIAIMQLGTAGSILVYFRRELSGMARAVSADAADFARARRRGFRPDTRLAGMIAAASVPIGAAGLLLQRQIEGGLTKEPTVIAWSLIGLALVLWWAERAGARTRPIESKTLRDAVIIGLAQAVALVPGASRSGTTIAAGLFLGYTREAAARFSFLLSIPAVIASGLFQLYDARTLVAGQEALPLLLAVAAGGVTGYGAIAFLLRFLRTHSTLLFILYRIALGLLILLAVS